MPQSTQRIQNPIPTPNAGAPAAPRSLVLELDRATSPDAQEFGWRIGLSERIGQLVAALAALIGLALIATGITQHSVMGGIGLVTLLTAPLILLASMGTRLKR